MSVRRPSRRSLTRDTRVVSAPFVVAFYPGRHPGSAFRGINWSLRGPGRTSVFSSAGMEKARSVLSGAEGASGVALKIVINAVAAKIGGGVTYITNFLRHLNPLARDIEFEVLISPETVGKLGNLPPNIHLITTRIGHAGWARRLWWEQVTLRSFLKEKKADILFSSANFGMIGCPVKQILLIQNALYFSKAFQGSILPRYSPLIRVPFLLRRWLICQSARSADLVIVPSQATLNDMSRFARIPTGKTLLDPFGQVVAPSDSGPSEMEVRTFRQTIPGTIRLLYVSYYMAHKNLTTLLRAIPLLNGRGRLKFKLTTTLNPTTEGANWMVTADTDLSLTKQTDTRDCVQLIGPLTRAETDKLYPQFDIFVFPSLVESFGFPLVEAMSNKLPVVAADTPINREICGGAAVYFSPLDSEDLARQVERVALDQPLRENLSAAGLARVSALFQWDRHVERFLAAARELHSR